jgi:hypothetical protein
MRQSLRLPSCPARIAFGWSAKGFYRLRVGHQADRDTALSIFPHIRARLAPDKRVRSIAFAELPKTISGKIRRVELRCAEAARAGAVALSDEYRGEDLKELSRGPLIGSDSLFGAGFQMWSARQRPFPRDSAMRDGGLPTAPVGARIPVNSASTVLRNGTKFFAVMTFVGAASGLPDAD